MLILQINQYTPINRVPAHILSEIFEHFSTASHSCSNGTPENNFCTVPWILCQVSRSWREVAFRAPKIWCSMAGATLKVSTSNLLHVITNPIKPEAYIEENVINGLASFCGRITSLEMEMDIPTAQKVPSYYSRLFGPTSRLDTRELYNPEEARALVSAADFSGRRDQFFDVAPSPLHPKLQGLPLAHPLIFRFSAITKLHLRADRSFVGRRQLDRLLDSIESAEYLGTLILECVTFGTSSVEAYPLVHELDSARDIPLRHLQQLTFDRTGHDLVKYLLRCIISTPATLRITVYDKTMRSRRFQCDLTDVLPPPLSLKNFPGLLSLQDLVFRASKCGGGKEVVMCVEGYRSLHGSKNAKVLDVTLRAKREHKFVDKVFCSLGWALPVPIRRLSLFSSNSNSRDTTINVHSLAETLRKKYFQSIERIRLENYSTDVARGLVFKPGQTLCPRLHSLAISGDICAEDLLGIARSRGGRKRDLADAPVLPDVPLREITISKARGMDEGLVDKLREYVPNVRLLDSELEGEISMRSDPASDSDNTLGSVVI